MAQRGHKLRWTGENHYYDCMYWWEEHIGGNLTEGHQAWTDIYFFPDKGTLMMTNADGKSFYSSYLMRLLSPQVPMITVPMTI